MVSDLLDSSSEWIKTILGIPVELQVKLAKSIAVLILLWLLRWFILRISRRKVKTLTGRYQWSRGTAYLFVTIGIVAISRIWFEGIHSLVTYLGIVSAGIAVALTDVLKNLAGWLFILWRSPFKLGDRIEIGNKAGDVIDQRIFQFSLLEIGEWVEADQSTGRVIHVPNGQIFTHTLANFSGGFDYIWSEISVLVTFESDWKKAKNILSKIANEQGVDLSETAQQQIKAASQRYLIFYNKLTPIVYTTVKDSGVRLTIRFLTEPRKRRVREESIWEAILIEFAKHEDIDFAYPTTRFYRLNENS